MKKIIYIILFLNILIAQDHWETAIFASDEWEYIVPNEEPLSNWNDLNFVPGVFFPVWPFGSPDYFHADADINTGVSFPTNDFAYVNPYSGDAAIGFSNFLTTQGNPIFPTNSFFFADNYREYISSKLNTKLEIGEIFEVSIIHM